MQLGIYENDVKKPLSYESRPKSFEDFYGQEKALKIIKKMLDKKSLSNLIIYGPPGSGKTTISKIIASSLDYNFEYLNAINSGVSNIKEVSKRAKDNLLLSGKKTILLFDEIHRFNKSQQDSLLQDLEDGSIILIASTTENPFYNLNKAVISRCIILKFEKLKDIDIENIITSTAKKEDIKVDKEILEYIISIAKGDARTALNVLSLIKDTDLETVRSGIDIKEGYDDSDKYDRISALIKSIRGSDADASIYWLAALIEGAEDPMYIARRLVISASEDIGLANPEALNIAVSAMQATKNIGLPEARIILAQCVIYLALSPKSNSAYKAINSAMYDVSENRIENVPIHLRKEGKMQYKYPHDYKNNYVEQKYVGNPSVYYIPGKNKVESKFKEYWDKVKEKNNNGE